MLVGFLMLYIELAGLILTGGYAISSLFAYRNHPEFDFP